MPVLTRAMKQKKLDENKIKEIKTKSKKINNSRTWLGFV